MPKKMSNKESLGLHYAEQAKRDLAEKLEKLYEVAIPDEGFYMDDLNLVKQTNNLARIFHNRMGWDTPVGYLYYRTECPRARGFWDLAVLAQLELRQTEIEGNIDLDSPEYDDIYGLKAIQAKENSEEFLAKMQKAQSLVFANTYERTLIACKYKDYHNWKDLEKESYSVFLNEGRDKEEKITFCFVYLAPPPQQKIFHFKGQYVCFCDYAWKEPTKNNKSPNIAFGQWYEKYKLLLGGHQITKYTALQFDDLLGKNMNRETFD